MIRHHQVEFRRHVEENAPGQDLQKPVENKHFKDDIF